MRKPVYGVSDQVRHKPGCTATDHGYKLEISDLESRGIVLCSENQGADQLRGYPEADLRVCFRICKKPVFSQRGSFNMGCVMRKSVLAYAKTKVHISFADTAQLISAFVFATLIVQSLYFLNLKFQASGQPWLRVWFVSDLVEKPYRHVLS